jgi:hypothetical protein
MGREQCQVHRVSTTSSYTYIFRHPFGLLRLTVARELTWFCQRIPSTITESKPS